MQTEAHCSNVLVPTQLISFYEQAATSKSRASVCIVEIWFDAYQDVHHPSSRTFGSLFEIRASVMWLTPKSSSADAAIGAAACDRPRLPPKLVYRTLPPPAYKSTDPAPPRSLAKRRRALDGVGQASSSRLQARVQNPR
jgi:hypothetical protein